MNDNPLVVVCGSRKWPAWYRWFIGAKMLECCPPDVVLLTGGARGVDQWAEDAARDAGWRVRDPILPDYDRYPPRRAPLERNTLLLNENPGLVLAFHWGNSGGTFDTLRKATRRGIPFLRFNEENLADELTEMG